MLVAGVAIVLQLVVGMLFALYRGRFFYGAFDEVRTLGVVVAVVAVLIGVPILIFGVRLGVARSTVFIAFPIALLLMCAVRYASRVVRAAARRPDEQATPVLVVGAGSLGALVVRTVMSDPRSPLRVVGILDDDPYKQKLQLHGVPVVGTTHNLKRAAQETDAAMVVIAISRADSAFLRRITDAAQAEGLTVSVTPPLSQIVAGKALPTDLRKVSIEDLIGRRTVDTNVGTIAGYRAPDVVSGCRLGSVI